jgi:sugar lactone lactonase YvrE
MPVDGGPAIQVSRGDGFYVRESWDARSVYYSDAHGEGIWRVPVDGGEATPVVRGVGFLNGWDLSPTGIYYAISQQLDLASEEYTIRFLDFKTGRTQALFRKRGPFFHDTLAVSPDEKWILYDEQAVPQSELMLIENFR